jgi:hypothetical protein
MLRCVDLVRTDVLEEPSASFVRVTRIGELETTLAVTSNRRTLHRNTIARALYDEDSLQAEFVFLKDVIEQNGYNDRQINRALNRRPHKDQPDNETHSVAFLPFVLSSLCISVQRASVASYG